MAEIVLQFMSTFPKGIPVTMADKASSPSKPGPEILSELFETHHDKVVRYIFARVGNMAQAEDMCGDVFAKAVEALDNFQWRSIPIEAWIFRIAHNIVIDYYRKNSKSRNLPIEAAANKVGMSTQDQVDINLEIKELAGALDVLTEQQRNILALRFGAGMSSEEVAKAMGKKAGAVRELQSSAIKKLRVAMDKPSEKQSKAKPEEGISQA